jgi:hypothetical protein
MSTQSTDNGGIRVTDADGHHVDLDPSVYDRHVLAWSQAKHSSVRLIPEDRRALGKYLLDGLEPTAEEATTTQTGEPIPYVLAESDSGSLTPDQQRRVQALTIARTVLTPRPMEGSGERQPNPMDMRDMADYILTGQRPEAERVNPPQAGVAFDVPCATRVASYTLHHAAGDAEPTT